MVCSNTIKVFSKDPDKQFLLQVIESFPDPESVMKNYRQGLVLIHSQIHYDAYANSGFFVVVREDNGMDTREEGCQRIADHFGLI